MCALIDGILERGTMSCKEAQVARGRLAFCDAFIFGRSGKNALQQITQHAYAKPFRKDIGLPLMRALSLLRHRMSQPVPRVINSAVADSFFLYTDAMFNSDRASGLGGVLVDPCGEVCSWFSCILSADIVQPFFDNDEVTIIGELETLAVALALFVWEELLKSRHVVCFIDNEGSKFSLIRGYSSSLSISVICDLVARTLDSEVIIPWFSRIPSASNLADAPSREMKHPLLQEELRANKELVERKLKILIALFEVHRRKLST